jgi:hypothetical protein
MPDFSSAEITSETQDLTPYRAFFERLRVGQVVTLPLEAGEGSRRVMRALNTVAREHAVRLARLPSPADAVRFRVLPGEKRRVALAEDTKRARGAKTRTPRSPLRPESPAAGSPSGS